MYIIRNLKGTHDILPPESNKWQQLEKIVNNSCKIFGYEEIRTPIFEQTQLFSRSVGSETDIVSKYFLSLSLSIIDNTCFTSLYLGS